MNLKKSAHKLNKLMCEYGVKISTEK